MRHPFICSTIQLAFIVLATQLIIVRGSSPVQGSHGAERRLYIVYMGEPLESSHEVIKAAHHSMLSSVLPSLEIAEQSHRHSFTKNINGYAALLTQQEASNISDRQDVASVFESRILNLHTTRSWNLMGFSSLTPRNFESEGDIITGVMDTGVWPESGSYDDHLLGPIPGKWRGSCDGGDNFNASNCNRKLIGARYYAGDAKGGVPGARISAYKVCWEGGCSDADILAAFDDAIYDGVDMLSLSFGGPAFQNLFADSIAIGSFHAIKKGIVVSCSAGNDGPDPGEATNVAPWVITVAASNIDRQFYSTVVLGNNFTLKGRAINTQVPEGSYPLIYGAHAGLNNLSRNCSGGSLDPTKVKGKIVVCESGKKTEQSTSVFSAGGVGMLFIDDSASDIGAYSLGIPSTMIGIADGDAIKAYMNSSSWPTAQILPTSSPTHQPAPLLASFSSRGPNQVMYPVLKPDVTAPGVNILASWSPAQSITGEPQDTRFVSYNILSGTSMSCPHVSGAAAYVKSFHPDWSPAAIKSALMTTARPLDVRHPSNEDGEFGYGSGHIDPLRAAHPGLVYDISQQEYAEYLCDQGYEPRVVRIVIRNETACSTKGGLRDLNYPAISVPVEAGTDHRGRRWWEFRRTVTNVGNATSVYKAEVEVPLGMIVEVTPATIYFSELNEQKTFLIRVKAPGLKTSISPRFGTRLSASLVWSDGVFSVRSPIVAWVAP